MTLRQRLRKWTMLFLMITCVITGCSNLYTPLANKTSDEARYEEAVKYLNALNYDSAITEFESLSPAFLATSQVREYYASALAGKCGFSFSGFLNFLSTADFSASPFFKSLMNQYTGRVVSPAHCSAAEAQIKAIWAVETPTSSQQFFMVMLSMSKMGAYLRSKADLDGTDNLGDDAPDASFNSCTNSNAHLTDDEVKEVITGFSLMLLNITGFLGSFSGGTATAISSIDAACALMTPNPCATTETSAVTAPMVASMRDLLATNVAYTPVPLGIGSCTLPTPIGDCCP